MYINVGTYMVKNNYNIIIFYGGVVFTRRKKNSEIYIFADFRWRLRLLIVNWQAHCCSGSCGADNIIISIILSARVYLCFKILLFDLCVFFLSANKVQRSEEEAVQMEPFSDDNKRHSRGDSQDECDENDKLIMCRICYDG